MEAPLKKDLLRPGGFGSGYAAAARATRLILRAREHRHETPTSLRGKPLHKTRV